MQTRTTREYREVGKNGATTVFSDEQFSWPVIAEQFEEVIEEVCKEKEEKLKAAEPVKKTTKPKRRIPAGVK